MLGADDSHVTMLGADDSHVSMLGADDSHVTMLGADDPHVTMLGADDPHVSMLGADDPHVSMLHLASAVTMIRGASVVVQTNAKVPASSLAIFAALSAFSISSCVLHLTVSAERPGRG
jgi:hypothetical protein